MGKPFRGAARREGTRHVHGEPEANVYIGIGTLVLILLVILIVWALRGRTV
jgi:hypothetical protein